MPAHQRETHTGPSRILHPPGDISEETTVEINAGREIALGEELIPGLMNINSDRHAEDFLVLGSAIPDAVREEFSRESELDPAGKLKVGDLLDRGYVFYNRVPGGSQPIFGAVNGTNLSARLFLTRDELVHAVGESIPAGFKAEDVRSMADDMTELLSLVLVAHDIQKALKGDDRGFWFNNAVGTPAVRMMAELWHNGDFILKFGGKKWGDFMMPMQSIMGELHGLVAGEFAGVASKVEKVRGLDPAVAHEVILDSRAGKMRSPILVLPDGERVLHHRGRGIYLPQHAKNGDKPRGGIRINDITVHLARHGICNTPDPQDQNPRYMTLAEYRRLYELRDQGPALEDIRLEARKIQTVTLARFAELVVRDLRPQIRSCKGGFLEKAWRAASERYHRLSPREMEALLMSTPVMLAQMSEQDAAVMQHAVEESVSISQIVSAHQAIRPERAA